MPEAKDNYVIGMSQANRAEPWREAMDSQIAAAAAAYPEFEVVFQDAAQDNADQVSDVENLLTQGIDLLIISPNEAAPLNDAVKAAWDACVPVIVLDRNLVDPNYSMFIGADNVAIGKAAGEYAAKWCADNGRTACKIAEIRGLEGAPPAKDRGDGFRAGLEAGGLSDANIVFSQNADWLREKAVPAAAAAFQAVPRRGRPVRPQRPHGRGCLHRRAGRRHRPLARSSSSASTPCRPLTAASCPSSMVASASRSSIPPAASRPSTGPQNILDDHVNPPLWLVLPFDTVSPENAQEVCNTFACPKAE